MEIWLKHHPIPVFVGDGVVEGRAAAMRDIAAYVFAVVVHGAVGRSEHAVLLKGGSASVGIADYDIHAVGRRQRHEVFLHGIDSEAVADGEDFNRLCRLAGGKGKD